MGDEWYCRIAGVEHGPLPFPDLAGLAVSKQLTRVDEVRFGSEGPWSRAESIEGLFSDQDGTAADARTASAAAPEPEPEFARDLSEFQLGDAARPDETPSINAFETVDDPWSGDWYARALGIEFGPLPL